MRKEVLALGGFLACGFFGACDDNGASVNENSRNESRVDTLYISNQDTIVAIDTIHSVDTVVLSNIDTLILNRIDTLIQMDTTVLNNVDTLIQKDTVYSVDTLVLNKVDTLLITDTLVVGEPAEPPFGYVTDPRDNRTYRTVKIGSQEWMAENLNYRYMGSTETDDSLSFCLFADEENCKHYGRLYFWSAAMDSAGTFSQDAVGCGKGVTCDHKDSVQGICMEGWHLPSADEWLQLIDYAGGEKKAYSLLESQDDWGKRIEFFRDEETLSTSRNEFVYRGVDAYGFNVKPYVSFSDPGPGYAEIFEAAFYCSSTEDDENYMMGVEFGRAGLSVNPSMKNRFHIPMMEADQGFSVRCVKN